IRPPSTSAIAASAATTSLVFFNNRLSPPLLLTSPVAVSEGPSGFGSDASDRGESQAGDRNRRQRHRAEVRDGREVENDQGAGDRRDERVRRSQVEPPLQEAAERQRNARNPEERDRPRDQDHKRNDGQKDQGESQQGNRPDGEQEHGDARGQRDLDSMTAFEPLDRDSGPVGKQKQHGQGEEHQAGSIAEKGAKGLQRAHRAEPAEGRSEADLFRKPGPDESRGIRTWALNENGLGRADQEGRVRPERGAVERGVGYCEKHADRSEYRDQDRPTPTSQRRRSGWLCRRLLRVAGRRAFTFLPFAHAPRCSVKRGVALWSSFASRDR